MEKEKKEVGVNRQKWMINPLISFTSLNPKVKYSTSKWNYLQIHKIKNKDCHWYMFWSSHIQIFIL